MVEIKSEAELANIMGMAFVSYGNLMQQNYGVAQPFKPLMYNGSAVAVYVRLTRNGSVSVEEGPDVDGYEAEIRNLKRKISEQEKEISSLNILLEEQKPKEEEKEEEKQTIEFDYPEPLELKLQTVEEEKPKKKRKKKK